MATIGGGAFTTGGAFRIGKSAAKAELAVKAPNTTVDTTNCLITRSPNCMSPTRMTPADSVQTVIGAMRESAIARPVGQWGAAIREHRSRKYFFGSVRNCRSLRHARERTEV